MSSLTQQQQSQQVQQPSQQQGAQQQAAATDRSAFSVGTASAYQGSLGNQGVQAAAGMEGQEQEGVGGMELVQQVDPSLASRLQNQLDLSTDTASECEGLLGGTHAQPCVDDIYTVQDHIWAELDGLEALFEEGTDEDMLAAMARLEQYERNLSSCVLLADSERCIREMYKDSELLEILAVFAGASAEVQAMEKPVTEVTSGIDAMEAHLAKITQAFAQLEDVALKAELDILFDELTGCVGEVTKGFRATKGAVEFFFKNGASFAKDVLFDVFSRGPEASVSEVEKMQKGVDLMNESVGVKLPDPKGLKSGLDAVSPYLERIREVDDAYKLAQEGLKGIEGEWDKLTTKTAPKVMGRKDLSGKLATALSGAQQEQAIIEETIAVFREQADAIRSDFPDRATQLG